MKFRDVVREANGLAFVLKTCTLKGTLKTKLRRMEYSEDSDKINAHVSTFIQGLFGRTEMRLFGGGQRSS
jgi:hypothetical protein